jgi:periodic tryptophan protein 2
LIALVLEKIPYLTIDLIAGSIPELYVDKLLAFISTQLEKSAHLEFYLTWSQYLLYKHGNQIKQRATAKMGVLCNLEKSLTKKYEDLTKM